MKKTLRSASMAALALGCLNAIGCMGGGSRIPSVQERYANYVDPCYPQRYSYQAREAVLAPFDAHVNNGQIIDQTIWNYHFKEASDELTAAGRQKLDGLSRRLPHPDTRIFIQTARDLAYDSKNPGKLVTDRSTLDVKRANAVLAYLNAQPTTNEGVTYQVQAIDPFDPGVNSAGPANSVRGLPAQYRSTLTGATGGATTGTGGGMATANPGQGQLQTTSPSPQTPR